MNKPEYLLPLEGEDRGGGVPRRRPSGPQPLPAGENVEIRWDPGVGASGVYFLRVVAASGASASTRVVILD